MDNSKKNDCVYMVDYNNKGFETLSVQTGEDVKRYLKSLGYEEDVNFDIANENFLCLYLGNANETVTLKRADSVAEVREFLQGQYCDCIESDNPENWTDYTIDAELSIQVKWVQDEIRNAKTDFGYSSRYTEAIIAAADDAGFNVKIEGEEITFESPYECYECPGLFSFTVDFDTNEPELVLWDIQDYLFDFDINQFVWDAIDTYGREQFYIHKLVDETREFVSDVETLAHNIMSIDLKRETEINNAIDAIDAMQTNNTKEKEVER